MGISRRLDFNLNQQSFEPIEYLDSGGLPIGFRGAAVLHGGTDLGELYQAAADGRVYNTETGLTDNLVGISVLGLTKRYSLQGYVGMAHSLYLRLEAVTADTVTVTVTGGGSEYGEIEREYSVNVAGTNDLEIRVRLHREILGRWLQVRFSGSVSNRPAVREAILRYLPVRSGRVSA